MCDYSLESIANRPAKVGEKLVLTQFKNSFTRGFSAVGEPEVAICLLPGTELDFDRDVECDHPLGFFPKKNLGEKVARFRQINLRSHYEHHDAVEFPSGKVVLLTPVPGPTRNCLTAAGGRPNGRQSARSRDQRGASFRRRT